MTNIQMMSPPRWCGEIGQRPQCEQGYFQKASDATQVKRCKWNAGACKAEAVFTTCDQTTACEKEVCSLPSGATDYSVITQGNAVLAAHMFYTKGAIGGNLKDGTPNENGAWNGWVCVGGTIQGNWNFNKGRKTGCQLGSLFNWKDFEQLALKAASVTEGQYKVKVFNNGGTYDLFDVRDQGQGEDNGKSLAIFTSSEPVILKGTSSGRKFGPSVLAPFAQVTLKGDAGFIDGFLIAKSIGGNAGNNAGSLQMHGDSYKGPIYCYKTGTMTTATTAATALMKTTATTTTTTETVASANTASTQCADLCEMTNIQMMSPPRWCGEIGQRPQCEQGYFQKASDATQVKRCKWNAGACKAEAVFTTCDQTTACEKEVCSLPSGATDYSVITQGNAVLAAHMFYTKGAIGGNLKDGTPNENGAWNGWVCVGGTIQGNWNFNKGRKTGCQLGSLFNWKDFEQLALKAASVTEGQYKVKVFNNGGTYDLFDVRDQGQGEDNGKSLAIFTSSEPVILKGTSSGRKFGPSVLAPFAQVTLKGDAGFIDGFLIAKSIGGNAGNNAGSLQMHGDSYKGPIYCYKNR